MRPLGLEWLDKCVLIEVSTNALQDYYYLLRTTYEALTTSLFSLSFRHFYGLLSSLHSFP